MTKNFLLMKTLKVLKAESNYVCIYFLLISLLCLISCSSSSTHIAPELPAPTLKTAPTTLGPGDEIDIKFTFWPEMNDTQIIRPDGKISLPIIDDVHVEGLTPGQLDRLLTERYDTKLKNPDITVIVRSLANQKVYVGGEVQTPGLLELQGNLTALQAIFYSGGFRETAKPEKTIVIRKDADNRPTPIHVNLQQMLNGEASGTTFQLKPADVVYVPKSDIAKANKFVNEYIEQLILFRGVSFGVSYNLNDDDDDD